MFVQLLETPQRPIGQRNKGKPLYNEEGEMVLNILRKKRKLRSV